MPSPKESFQVSGKSDEFKKIALSEAFEIACDYALLELVHSLPPNVTPGAPSDPYVGIDANAQLWGARRVLAILKTMSDPIEKPEPAKRPTLKY